MTYTDEQIAEALERSDSYHGQAGTGLQEAVIVLASALRAAQERIKEIETLLDPGEGAEGELDDSGNCAIETKTVPMELFAKAFDVGESMVCCDFRAEARKIAARYGYTVTESDKEEPR